MLIEAYINVIEKLDTKSLSSSRTKESCDMNLEKTHHGSGEQEVPLISYGDATLTIL